MLKFCIPIGIDKSKPLRLSNDIWDWSRFCLGSNSEKVKLAKSLECLVYFDLTLKPFGIF